MCLPQSGLGAKPGSAKSGDCHKYSPGMGKSPHWYAYIILEGAFPRSDLTNGQMEHMELG